MIVSAYPLPVITYPAPVWGYLAAIHKKKLQSVLNRGLRLAAKVPPSLLITPSKERTQCPPWTIPLGGIKFYVHKIFAHAARFPDNPFITRPGQYRIWLYILLLFSIPLVFHFHAYIFRHVGLPHLLLPISAFSLFLLFLFFVNLLEVPVFAVSLLRMLLSSDWYPLFIN